MFINIFMLNLLSDVSQCRALAGRSLSDVQGDHLWNCRALWMCLWLFHLMWEKESKDKKEDSEVGQSRGGLKLCLLYFVYSTCNAPAVQGTGLYVCWCAYSFFRAGGTKSYMWPHILQATWISGLLSGQRRWAVISSCLMKSENKHQLKLKWMRFLSFH